MLQARVAILTVAFVAGSVAIARPMATAEAASYAAPEIIIFHGGPLVQPIVIASWTENHTLLLTGEPRGEMRRDAATPRFEPPRIELALFWGSRWREYARSPARLGALSPAQATQTGLYFPAVAGSHATIAVGSIRGPLSDSGLAVLRRHGIPTHIP